MTLVRTALQDSGGNRDHMWFENSIGNEAVEHQGIIILLMKKHIMFMKKSAGVQNHAMCLSRGQVILIADNVQQQVLSTVYVCIIEKEGGK